MPAVRRWIPYSLMSSTRHFIHQPGYHDLPNRSRCVKPRTDALAFSWTPTATPITRYQNQRLRLPRLQQRITSRPGSVKCIDRDSIKVKTVPYPIARSIKDTSICFRTIGTIDRQRRQQLCLDAIPVSFNPFIPNPVSVQPGDDILIYCRSGIHWVTPNREEIPLPLPSSRLWPMPAPRIRPLFSVSPCSFRLPEVLYIIGRRLHKMVERNNVSNPTANPQMILNMICILGIQCHQLF